MKATTVLLTAVSVLGFVLFSTVSAREQSASPKPPDAKKFLGLWMGTMKDMNSKDAPEQDLLPVTLNLKEFEFGKWCGPMSHADPMNASGKLLGIKFDGKTMTLSQSIDQNRKACMDGINQLTLIDKDTMERIWINPDTGKPSFSGKLTRQK